MPENTSLVSSSDIEATRSRTLDVLDQLTAVAAEFALPQLPAAFETYRRKLQETRYTVLVVGEAKRGKSTFVNAILGRDLLPTDVDVATCQVFRVKQAPNENYRVRFEDDSAQEITATDLPRYGSHVLAERAAVPQLDRVIRWIEVEGPFQFLPQEITLLDTPGLGSLHAAHAQITQRFVPLADAVIFVLHSDSPVGQAELSFLEEILGVTRSVFFIQTMIDRYQRRDWQAIQARNEQVLAERFAEQLADRRVWPVASPHLLKAVQTGDRDYELVSKFPPLFAALWEFLFRVAGWGRAAEALLLAHSFQQEMATILTTRWDGLNGPPDLKRTALRQQLALRTRQLEEQWGEQGQRRRRLLESLRQVAADQKQAIWQALQPDCKIEVEQREGIDSVTSIDEAKQLANVLSPHVLQAATARWRQATGRFQARCLELLQPFFEDTNLISGSQDDSPSDLAVRSGLRLDFGEDSYLKIKLAAVEFVEGTVLVAGAGWIVSLVVATSWFPPVAIAGSLAAGLWGALRGWQWMGGAQLQDARAALHQHLDEVFQQMRSYFFGADSTTDRISLTDHYFETQLRLLSERIATHAADKMAEAQANMVRLAEAAELDEVQRQQQAQVLVRQLKTWSEFGTEIAALAEQLKRLEHCR